VRVKRALARAAQSLVTLRESIVDALVEVRVNRARTILQTLGVILGVATPAAASR